MKKTILSVAIVAGLSMSAISQATKPAAISDAANLEKEKVYTKVDVQASFTGGATAWRNFLQNNLNGNIAAAGGAASGSYTVIIKFIVDKNGSLRNFTAETNKGFGMETEAIRVLQLSPAWVPATVAGSKVRSYFRQPVTFLVP